MQLSTAELKSVATLIGRARLFVKDALSVAEVAATLASRHE